MSSCLLSLYIYIYIYLGLGSYQLTIKERNGGVGFRGKNRVVKESVSCIADMALVMVSPNCCRVLIVGVGAEY